MSGKLIALGSLTEAGQPATRWFPKPPVCANVAEVHTPSHPPHSLKTKTEKFEMFLVATQRPREWKAVKYALYMANRDLSGYLAKLHAFCLGEAAPSPSGDEDRDAQTVGALAAQLPEWAHFDKQLAAVREGLDRKHSRVTADPAIDAARTLGADIDRFVREHYCAVPPLPRIPSVFSRLPGVVRRRHREAVEQIDTYLERAAAFYCVAELARHRPGLAAPLDTVASGVRAVNDISAQRLGAKDLAEQLDRHFTAIHEAMAAIDAGIRDDAARLPSKAAEPVQLELADG